MLTCWEYVALYTLTATGMAQAHWPMRPPTVMAVLVQMPPIFWGCGWTWPVDSCWQWQQFCWGPYGEGNNFVIFWLLGFHHGDKGVKVLVCWVILVFGTKVCKSAVLEGHRAFYFLFYLLCQCYQKGSPIVGSGAPDKRNDEDFVAKEKSFDCWQEKGRGQRHLRHPRGAGHMRPFLPTAAEMTRFWARN